MALRGMKSLAVALLVVLCAWGVGAAAETHRYIYIPTLAVLVDIDNWPSNAFEEPVLNALPFALIMQFIGYDWGFTYLEGPPIPSDWLDDPALFKATLSRMKRIDVAVHTQGANTIYEEQVFEVNGQQVPSIAYPPQLSDPNDLHLLRLGGGFWWAWVYAGLNSGNIVNDILTVTQWNTLHGQPYPRHFEIVLWKNYKVFKIYTFYTGAPGDPKALARDLILDIVENAGSCDTFVIDYRTELSHHPQVQPFPSGRMPFNLWLAVSGRFHKAQMKLESHKPWSKLLEPRLSAWPIRDPRTPICPHERYTWHLPQILAPLHNFFSQDNGERCFDVDTLVELDLANWWNPLGYQFYELLTPEPFIHDMAKAWVFFHVATNNGHRLIDTVNPKNEQGNQIESIVDVAAFDPEIYPWTFEGGPKIHGYHKVLVSCTISEFYKRMHYILGATGEEREERENFFRNNLEQIISDVHIYTRDPDTGHKREINVLELFQMIAERWSAERAFSLLPFRFFWIDMPVKDYGQGKPVTFEITCMFDTNPNLGGPYVPIRIIAQAHEAAYLTTEYGDVFYLLLTLLRGGEIPDDLPLPFPFPFGSR